ncbi:Uncharacterised protein [Burkholderia pseudomallei]|nr:hypothetical protein DO73_3636 [Burkholderia pseudomallei]CAJ8126647.1 Uncharacterised protein [Burkholderia pseudomallei]CAJ9333809.1 Uncharacterised protein [Burkholderia pseudomallei]
MSRAARRCSSGSWPAAAASRNRAASASSATGASFQYSLPAASIDTVIVSGVSRAGAAATFGKSSRIACVKSGAVMMKMTSSTSITSMSGVMLMSAIGCDVCW